jgi:hypothetical protein
MSFDTRAIIDYNDDPYQATLVQIGNGRDNYVGTTLIPRIRTKASLTFSGISKETSAVAVLIVSVGPYLVDIHNVPIKS